MSTITYEQAEHIISLLTDFREVSIWTLGSIFILVGILVIQVFLVGKGED